MNPLNAMFYQSTRPVLTAWNDYPRFSAAEKKPRGRECATCALVKTTDMVASVRLYGPTVDRAASLMGFDPKKSLFVYESPSADGGWIRTVSAEDPPDDSRQWFLAPRKSAAWLRALTALAKTTNPAIVDILCALATNLGAADVVEHMSLGEALANPSPGTLLVKLGGSIWLLLQEVPDEVLFRGVTGAILALANKMALGPADLDMEDALFDLSREWRAALALPGIDADNLFANRLINFLLGEQLEKPMTRAERTAVANAVARAIRGKVLTKRNLFFLCVAACFLAEDDPPKPSDGFLFSEYAHRWAAIHRNTLFTTLRGALFFAAECVQVSREPPVDRALLGDAEVPIVRLRPGEDPPAEIGALPPFRDLPARPRDRVNFAAKPYASPFLNRALDWTLVGAVQGDGRVARPPKKTPGEIAPLWLDELLDVLPTDDPAALPEDSVFLNQSVADGFVLPMYVSEHRRWYPTWIGLNLPFDAHPAFIAASVYRGVTPEFFAVGKRVPLARAEPMNATVQEYVNETAALFATMGAARWQETVQRFFWDVLGDSCYPFAIPGDSPGASCLGTVLNWCLSVIETDFALDGSVPWTHPTVGNRPAFTAQGKLMFVTWFLTVGLAAWAKHRLIDGASSGPCPKMDQFFGPVCRLAPAGVAVPVPYSPGAHFTLYPLVIDYKALSLAAANMGVHKLNMSINQIKYVLMLLLPCVKLSVDFSVRALVVNSRNPLTPYKCITSHVRAIYDHWARPVEVPFYVGPLTPSVDRTAAKLCLMLSDPEYDRCFVGRPDNLHEKIPLDDIVDTLSFDTLSLM